MNKQQLEMENSKLKHELESLKADCSILLKENIDLLALCEKHVPDFKPATLFSAQWRGEE